MESTVEACWEQLRCLSEERSAVYSATEAQKIASSCYMLQNVPQAFTGGQVQRKHGKQTVWHIGKTNPCQQLALAGITTLFGRSMDRDNKNVSFQLLSMVDVAF